VGEEETTSGSICEMSGPAFCLVHTAPGRARSCFLLLVYVLVLHKQSHNHRIIESLKLEKTSKIIKSNYQPNTTMPAKLCPEVPYLHVF